MSQPSTERVLFDANLIVLLAVGSVSRSLIGNARRVKQFTVDQFDFVAGVASNASMVTLCPNVVTEASNLLRQVSNPGDVRFSLALAELVKLFEEAFEPSERAVSQAEYIRLGITDAVLLGLAESGGATLYTSDLALYLAAMHAGYPAFNVNHLLDV